MRGVRKRLRRWLIAAEAASALTVASVLVARLPATRTTRLLGATHARPRRSTAAAGRRAEAVRIGRAVERVATVLPWHPVCLPRAVAVRAMLRRRGISCEAHLGVIDDDPLHPHAWVTVGATVVQGATARPTTTLATFR